MTNWRCAGAKYWLRCQMRHVTKWHLLIYLRFDFSQSWFVFKDDKLHINFCSSTSASGLGENPSIVLSFRVPTWLNTKWATSLSFEQYSVLLDIVQLLLSAETWIFRCVTVPWLSLSRNSIQLMKNRIVLVQTKMRRYLENIPALDLWSIIEPLSDRTSAEEDTLYACGWFSYRPVFLQTYQAYNHPRVCRISESCGSDKG